MNIISNIFSVFWTNKQTETSPQLKPLPNLYEYKYTDPDMLDMSPWHGNTDEEKELNQYFESKIQSRPIVIKGKGYNVVSMVAQCSLDKSGIINVNIPVDKNINVEQIVGDACGFSKKIENMSMLRGLIMDSLESNQNRPNYLPTIILNVDHDRWASDSPRVIDPSLDRSVRQIAKGLTDFGLMNAVIVYNNHTQDHNFRNIIV